MTPEEGRSSRAVLFGVHEFRHFGDLTGVQHSLAAFRDVLADQDICALPEGACEVVPADAPPGGFLDALEDAAEAAEHLLVVYYAGHGHHEADGTLLLATRASSVPRPYHSVRYETVRRIVAGSRALHKVVIIDCCWSGLVHMDGENAGATAFAVPGTCVLSSAAATEKSLCEPGGSVFTLALTKLLGEGLSGQLSDGAFGEHVPRLAMDQVYDALCVRLAGREVAGQKVPQPRMSALDAGHRIAIARNRAYVGVPIELEALHAEYERLAARRIRPDVQNYSSQQRSPPGHGAQCPYCLRYMPFDANRLFQFDERYQFLPTALDDTMHPALRHRILQNSFHECPFGEQGDHAPLPAQYFLHDEPLTIALIGSSTSGRTTLLAAMISQIEEGLLEPLGVRCMPLSTVRHDRYRKEGNIHLYREGKEVSMTPPHIGSAVELLVTGGGKTRPVIFFDVADGTLDSTSLPQTQFITGATAFIFTLDPINAFRGAALEHWRRYYGRERSVLGDRMFNQLIDALPWQSQHAEAHATVAVVKSDLLSADPIVQRWLSTELGPNDGNPGEESRDAYAYARHYGGVNWVKPFHYFSRCTLHFVSATGGHPSPGGDYAFRPRPQRVLAPLLSIFTAAGLLDTEEGQLGGTSAAAP
ncbi:caspase family protein [Streptomyces sp. HNM0663]|uniref:Caspase family protein n=1 Tax=Streptomyces chengmaiensis TaxID=3040919 RepID=A0ABT6HFZ6_9ACTN|nr:caspase family protein [Streptomyces chengmaiensis]MDH2387687.1 caspase family protein [Streptomyces chengmaiensis]